MMISIFTQPSAIFVLHEVPSTATRRQVQRIRLNVVRSIVLQLLRLLVNLSQV